MQVAAQGGVKQGAVHGCCPECGGEVWQRWVLRRVLSRVR